MGWIADFLLSITWRCTCGLDTFVEVKIEDKWKFQWQEIRHDYILPSETSIKSRKDVTFLVWNSRIDFLSVFLRQESRQCGSASIAAFWIHNTQLRNCFRIFLQKMKRNIVACMDWHRPREWPKMSITKNNAFIIHKKLWTPWVTEKKNE